MKAIVTHDPLQAAGLAGVLALVPGENLLTGREELERALAEPLTSLESDLLLVASAVFALDLAALRGEREHYPRDLQIQLPVANLHAFRALASKLAVILYLLSGDNWTLDFIQGAGTPERAGPEEPSIGTTLLFSGGLDSLAAAVTELEAAHPLYLASHYTASRSVRTSQRRLIEYLSGAFPDQVRRIAAHVTGRSRSGLFFPADGERERSQRTRSLLFLTIGALVARHTNYREILMIAENGQMAIHLPLSPSRIGAFSTHTAHPQFVDAVSEMLGELFSCAFTLVNPFLYHTKSEVVQCLATRHRPAIPLSVSCWRGSRQALNHCGQCVPCLLRRIALEINGVHIPEYQRDVLREDLLSKSEDDEGKRNLHELGEFISWFAPGQHSTAELLDQFPDLFNPSFDQTEAISMYRRFSVEAQQVLSAYPQLGAFLR